jgi:hypothetical protein
LNKKKIQKRLKDKHSTEEINQIIENTKNGKLSHNHKLNGDN